MKSRGITVYWTDRGGYQGDKGYNGSSYNRNKKEICKVVTTTEALVMDDIQSEVDAILKDLRQFDTSK